MTQIALLAWRPFLEPISVHEHWWVFLAPLALGISIVWKAVRLGTLEHYWRQVAMMTVQIIVGMVVLAAFSYVFVEVYVRFIADRAG